MAKIYPFKGILYNKKKVKKLNAVMSPPYDVISPEQQDNYYQISDYNMIKLILGKEFPGDTQYNNKYVRAAATFDGWMRHDILVRDPKPAIYVYEQKFSAAGKKWERIGFISLMRIEDGGRGRLFPHEETLMAPKMDRVELIRATQANFDCIFSLYQDPDNKIFKVLRKAMRKKPLIDVKDQDKAVNRLWRIDSRPLINKLMKEMKDKSVFIADGHHRFEAATRFKNEMKERNTRFSEDESYNHVMMYFTPAEGKGLVVLPIHRLVTPIPHLEINSFEEELKQYFDIKLFAYSKRTEPQVRKKALKELTRQADKHSFLMGLRDVPRYYLLTLKNEDIVDMMLEEGKPEAYKRLDVTILHSIVMKKILGLSQEEQISYAKNTDEAAEGIQKGPFQLVFFMNPTKVSDIIEIASKSEKMPQKSTFFYPKLLSGMVMNKIIHGEKVEY
ncbi:MAG TPA: DUF1015 domain-containing protein [Candidatus Omnitrophota bacterium]|nr:DUF1015 domain-containing protein [Candidatus Omnitrophota bacterium]